MRGTLRVKRLRFLEQWQLYAKLFHINALLPRFFNMFYDCAANTVMQSIPLKGKIEILGEK